MSQKIPSKLYSSYKTFYGRIVVSAKRWEIAYKMEAPNETSASANVRWRISTLNRDLCSYYQCILFKHNMCFNKLLLLPPTTKLGQGYIFHRRLWFCPRGGGSAPGGAWSGVGSASGGWCLVPGGCLLRGSTPKGRGTWSRRVPGGRPPRDGYCCGRVRILLECILVRVKKYQLI